MYLQLSMENHQWWGLSVISGGSAAFFVYLYCFYFLFTQSEMSGLLQLSDYFGYMALSCYGVFLMLGTVRDGSPLSVCLFLSLSPCVCVCVLVLL